DGGTVLVIVEYRDVALLDQRPLNLETLRGLDVFKIDATEGDGDALDRIDKGLGAFRIDFDVEYIHTGKALEQHAFAFHNGLGCQRSEIAQPENGSAIGNHCHQVAFAGIAV